MVDNEQLFLGFDKEQLTKLFNFMSIMIDMYVKFCSKHLLYTS